MLPCYLADVARKPVAVEDHPVRLLEGTMKRVRNGVDGWEVNDLNSLIEHASTYRIREEGAGHRSRSAMIDPCLDEGKAPDRVSEADLPGAINSDNQPWHHRQPAFEGAV